MTSSPTSRSTTLPSLPAEMNNAVMVETASLKEVPNETSLAQWLEARGVSTVGWGEGVTKSVLKLWKELKGAEAGLEMWRKADGTNLVLRTTHVLRGKVCSQKSYERGVFLFNTWQQFADGKKRTRNGLLSEKLNTTEIPLQDHLHEVCKRAVEDEEMCYVVEAAFVLSASNPAPEHDPEYQCPLQVVDERFVDYTIEVEESKSFPGLRTAYHLYTVDIICSGLPGVDFNTLEYAEPEYEGKRKLKYVHAWNWLNWPTIQRYLIEGSVMKESRRKGAFNSPDDLDNWLCRYGVSTERWGKDGFKGVRALFKEIENEEADLQLWGRHDGVSLLIRVVHVLQLKVVSDDPRLLTKFLLQTWAQSREGHVRDVSRLMSKKLTCAQVPFDELRFNKAAEAVIQSQLDHMPDVHFAMNPSRPPARADFTKSQVEVLNARLVGVHHDVEESPSFPGLHTMYHLYTMEATCTGLPSTDFTSLDFDRNSGPFAYGWKWRTLPESIDILHARAQAFERQDNKRRRALAETRRGISSNADELERLLAIAQRLSEASEASSSAPSRGGEEVKLIVSGLESALTSLRSSAQLALEEEKKSVTPLVESFPPAMLSKMASDSITTESVVEEIMEKARTEHPGRSAGPRQSGTMGSTMSVRAWVSEASTELITDKADGDTLI